MRTTQLGACVIIALAVGTSAAAQDDAVAPAQQQAEKMALAARKQALESVARVPFEQQIKGAPYSADVVVESTQTLADGNHISIKHTGRVYRDSEGRTRREQEGEMMTVSRAEPVISSRGLVITIVDPVAGVTYSLDPEHQVAWRTPTAVGATIMNKMAAAEAEMRAVEKERSRARAGGAGVGAGPIARNGAMAKAAPAKIEQRVIDGLAVECRVMSETLAAGAIGNERPIDISSEQCTSPDLKVLVLTKHSDPRTGDSTYQLTNIVRAEPDPSLFLVPPGYTIKDSGIRRPEPRR